MLDAVTALAKHVDRRVLDTLSRNRREEFITALASIVGMLERTDSV